MTSTRSHKDLIVWQKTRLLTVAVYKLSTLFPKSEQFSLVDQCRRASISVLSNIAEGAGRGGDKEFRQFLYLARGSLAELESQLLVSSDLGFVKNEHPIFDDIAEVGRMLNGLIASATRSLTAGGSS
jgi:four helix bundle protein